MNRTDENVGFRQLPSRFQVGDQVRVTGWQRDMRVTGVMFAQNGKVRYEIGGLLMDSDLVNAPAPAGVGAVCAGNDRTTGGGIGQP